MHGRERDRVGRRVPDVGVRLRVVVGSLVLEPVRERLVLLLRLGVEVDRLEVRDRLAELPELVEDELARAPGRPEPSPRACRAPRGTRGRGAGCCRRPTALPGRSRDPRPGRQAPPPSRRSRGEGSRPAQSARRSRRLDRGRPCSGTRRRRPVISGLSKRRFRPLTTYGMSRRRISATSGSASFATDRNSTAKSDHDRPRASLSAVSLKASPRIASMRSQIHAASASASAKSRAIRSPRSQRLVPRPRPSPSAGAAGGDPLGDRSARPRPRPRSSGSSRRASPGGRRRTGRRT